MNKSQQHLQEKIEASLNIAKNIKKSAYPLYSYLKLYYTYRCSFKTEQYSKADQRVYEIFHELPCFPDSNDRVAASNVRNMLLAGFEASEQYLKTMPYDIPTVIDIDCIHLYRFITEYISWISTRLHRDGSVTQKQVTSKLIELFSN